MGVGQILECAPEDDNRAVVKEGVHLLDGSQGRIERPAGDPAATIGSMALVDGLGLVKPPLLLVIPEGGGPLVGQVEVEVVDEPRAARKPPQGGLLLPTEMEADDDDVDGGVSIGCGLLHSLDLPVGNLGPAAGVLAVGLGDAEPVGSKLLLLLGSWELNGSGDLVVLGLVVGVVPRLQRGE